MESHHLSCCIANLHLLTHLRVIGYLCFATNLTQKDKFSPRAVKAVLIGYSALQKGYKLYDLDSKTFFVSRDVVFIESIFPFKGSEEDSHTHNMSHHHFSYDDLITCPSVNINSDGSAVSLLTKLKSCPLIM